MTTGIDLISQERRRQFEKGYTLRHDRNIGSSWLADAAARIVHRVVPVVFQSAENTLANYVLKKHGNDKTKQLVIAGALIAAELDLQQSFIQEPEVFWRVDVYSGSLRLRREICDSLSKITAVLTEVAKQPDVTVEVKCFKEQ